jgi:excisionase family DNA binding protein
MTDRLFTASDMARFCGVDNKTIHHWVTKGKLAHHRTEGRHLRFRRADVLDFLRSYGYPLPSDLTIERPRVAVVESDAAVLTALKRSLARRFEVFPFGEPIDALLGLAALDPDVLVLGSLDGMAAPRLVARLRAAASTRHLRVVVLSEASARDAALAAGANEVVLVSELNKLRDAIERLTG